MMRIPITKTVIDEAEQEAIIGPLKTGWLVQGPNVAEFERRFSAYINCQFAKATTSCTTALHLALDALGIGAGDKVVVPSFTYIASANAVELTGAQTIFCDIDLRTFNIDVVKLEQLIAADQSIKAIMPVHLFGLCADMFEVMKIANKYQLKVIEDAACAFDSRIQDQCAGIFGDCACFSFHPRKAITTGEGGMLITNDKELFQRVSQLADHGASKSDFQRHKEKGGSLLPEFHLRGFNYRMTDMQGALGVAQMDKARRIMAGRSRIAKKYDEALLSVPQLITPLVPEGYHHAYQSYVCLFIDDCSIESLDMQTVDKLNVHRNQFMNALEERGVATRQGTHAVHTLSFYKKRYNLQDENYLSAYAADRLSVSLPVYPQMTDEEFNYIISSIKEVLV